MHVIACLSVTCLFLSRLSFEYLNWKKAKLLQLHTWILYCCTIGITLSFTTFVFPISSLSLQRGQGFVFLQVLLLEQHGPDWQNHLVVGILRCSLPLAEWSILVKAVQTTRTLFQNSAQKIPAKIFPIFFVSLFALLEVQGVPLTLLAGPGQGRSSQQEECLCPCLAPSPPTSPPGWSPPPWGSSWPTCSCNTEILSPAKWMFYNYPSYQQPITWDRSGTDTRGAGMGHLTNNYWCINGQLWSK